MRKNYQCVNGGGRGARRGQQCTDKKEIKLSSYIRKFRRSGCKVIYD
jgi:hypothetical protein